MHLAAGGPEIHMHNNHNDTISRENLVQNTSILFHECDFNRLQIMEAILIEELMPTLILEFLPARLATLPYGLDSNVTQLLANLLTKPSIFYYLPFVPCNLVSIKLLLLYCYYYNQQPKHRNPPHPKTSIAPGPNFATLMYIPYIKYRPLMPSLFT